MTYLNKYLFYIMSFKGSVIELKTMKKPCTV